MSRTPLIPKAEITGLYGFALKRFTRKLLGDVPEPAEVMWHNQRVLKTMMGFGARVQKWDKLDRNLQSYASMAVASLVLLTNWLRQKDSPQSKPLEAPHSQTGT